MIERLVGSDHQHGGIMSGSTKIWRGNTLRAIKKFYERRVEL